MIPDVIEKGCNILYQGGVFPSYKLVYNPHWLYISLVIWSIWIIFPIILGMSSSQLTFTPSFFRGVETNHQPDNYGKSPLFKGKSPFLMVETIDFDSPSLQCRWNVPMKSWPTTTSRWSAGWPRDSWLDHGDLICWSLLLWFDYNISHSIHVWYIC
jgi:hypothetical protein